MRRRGERGAREAAEQRREGVHQSWLSRSVLNLYEMAALPRGEGWKTRGRGRARRAMACVPRRSKCARRPPSPHYEKKGEENLDLARKKKNKQITPLVSLYPLSSFYSLAAFSSSSAPLHHLSSHCELSASTWRTDSLLTTFLNSSLKFNSECLLSRLSLLSLEKKKTNAFSPPAVAVTLERKLH